MEKCILIHYGEIALKGKNRRYFEHLLVRNIKRIPAFSNTSAEFLPGRIVLKAKSEDTFEKIRLLSYVPGIKYYAVAKLANTDVDNLKKTCVEILKNENFSTFKVSTTRSYKNYPLNSIQVNEIVGEAIVKSIGKKVDLEKPDITIFIEICENQAYIYLSTWRDKGIGGLPVDEKNKVLMLFSGGIDSSTAPFLLMKRGCKVVFLHFYNERFFGREEMRKIKGIVEVLARYQGETDLYLVNFTRVQDKITAFSNPKHRMLLYRRAMLRIANEICEKENIKVISTGDSISQVASQTIDNIFAVYSISNFPIIPPLAGMDKEEVMDLARKIDTYELAIKPYKDLCSYMLDKHPTTKISKIKLDEEEKAILPINNYSTRKVTIKPRYA